MRLEPLEEALAIYREAGDAKGMARALALLGNVYHVQQDDDRARVLLEEGVALGRTSGDLVSLTQALIVLGTIEQVRGNLDGAQRLHEESLDLRRRHGSPQEVSQSLGYLGNVARIRGDYARARELFEEGLALSRSIHGNTARTGWHLGSLGFLAWLRGDLGGARALMRESLALVVEAGNIFLVAATISGLGEVMIAEGRAREGTRLVAAFDSLSPKTQGGLDPDERVQRDNSLAAARAILGDTAFEQARAEGQAMTLDQAIAAAMEV
jgi:tetratricopeptide (TPR) repeat protein